MLSVVRGSNVTVRAQLNEFTGGPALDPVGLTLQISYHGTVVVGPLIYGNSSMVRIEPGVYQYIWETTETLPTGTYLVEWLPAIGSASPIFLTSEILVIAVDSPFSSDPAVKVFQDHLTLRFYNTIKVSTITNSVFRLFTDTATPVELVDPFQAIDTFKDYETISRTISLYFKTALTTDIAYVLRVIGLDDVAGRSIPDQNYSFVTGDVTSFQPSAPVPDPISIVDHSIIPKPFVFADTITAPNPNFYIVETDPPSDIAFIDNYVNGGRITIKFSDFPGDRYITGVYFKAQRKLISRGLSKWEDVSIIVSRDPTRPWVYVDFIGSTDATPIFFASNYKYRLKISKNIGT